MLIKQESILEFEKKYRIIEPGKSTDRDGIFDKITKCENIFVRKELIKFEIEVIFEINSIIYPFQDKITTVLTYTVENFDDITKLLKFKSLNHNF